MMLISQLAVLAFAVLVYEAKVNEFVNLCV